MADAKITVGKLMKALRDMPEDMVITYRSYDDYQDDPVSWIVATEVTVAPADTLQQLVDGIPEGTFTLKLS
jgi:hypothetical protein